MYYTSPETALHSVINHGLIPEDHIEHIREKVENSDDYMDTDYGIIQELINENTLTCDQIRDALAEDFMMDIIDLDDVEIYPELLETLRHQDESTGETLAERYHAFPVYLEENTLHIALTDPTNIDATDDLAQYLNLEIITYLASADQLQEFLQRSYQFPGGPAGESSHTADFQQTTSELDDLDLNLDNLGDEDAGPILKYVQGLISDSVRGRASDIHLEPLETRFRIRLRVDGVLQEIDNPPKRLQPAIISRLKIQAGISIAEKRIPQDGRIQSSVDGKPIDLRVSTVPTNFGESIVMRILDKESLSIGLPQLGFFSDDQATFERMINMPDGIFLVTGPTGSGKSTTLYSALNVINKPDRKIITVEDPVEYQLKGINQVQVQREVNMTFAAALRAMLPTLSWWGKSGTEKRQRLQ